MKKMRCQIQRDNNEVLLPKQTDEEKNFDINTPKTISGMLNQKLADLNARTTARGRHDGYWITIQEWSMCTLKCGGGKSYFQRMCVPPVENGKPCQGESVLVKDCNRQPCPDIGGKGGKQNTDTFKTKSLKPIVKIMPFSARPQRYSKCVIKESDMMYTKKMNKNDSTTSNMKVDEKNEEEMQVPVRVIMNNRTITIFAGERFETALDSFNLLKSNFENIADKPECFYIHSDVERYARLCPFGCASNTAVVEEWKYDFNLFKFQCNFGHKEQQLDMDLENKLKDKIAAAKAGMMDEMQDEIKRKAQKELENKMATQSQKVNTIAMMAIQKEVNEEELLKREEQEREEREEREINLRIEKEKEKAVKKYLQ